MTERLALFDLDGTLVDSRPGIIGSLHAALRDLGHAPDPSIDLTWAIGPPLEQSLARVLAPYGESREALAAERYRHHYPSIGVRGAPVFPGMEAAMDALAASGWTLLVATSKRTGLARQVLAHTGLTDRFADIQGSEDHPALATKAGVIAAVLARRAAPGGTAVMIGDRHHDIEGARAHRLPAIGVAWGYGGAEELRAAGADAIAHDPAEIPALAESLAAAAGARG